jgi:X-X-X-Leu-X-X-Gly heptad repeat protein
MNVFNVKKLSWKIAAIVILAVLIVGGTVAFYYQIRTFTLIDEYSQLDLKYKTGKAAETSNNIFTDMRYRVNDLRRLAESTFSVSDYINDAENYFNNQVKILLDEYIKNTAKGDGYIQAAYLAINPNLAGYPLVMEIFYEKTEAGIMPGESQSYEDYMQVNSDEMAWFYGAFNSGEPYWTKAHEYDGVMMVSYTEPVIINNTKVGVVGVDLTIDEIVNVVKNIKVFDTGFAILMDNHSGLIQSNDFVKKLTDTDTGALVGYSKTYGDEIIEEKINDNRFYLSKISLVNDFKIIVLAPEKEYNAEVTLSLIRFFMIFPAAIIIIFILSILIGKSFSRPLEALSAIMQKAGATGDIMLSHEDREVLAGHAKSRDEIGQTIVSFTGFINRVNEVSNVLETVATGDLTIDLAPLSERDVMGNSLCDMSEKLSGMFEEINQSAAQVSAGSKQVADGAQSLASGATQQAASIEELSASISDIAAKTKQNTGMAEKAAELANTIKKNAEKGSRQMDEMMAAVNDINEASGSISKVIKVIDDIAFQTNILALNAAVEAARAGQHGKGFAVVAEEVRNLAAKSAEAAKDTGGLIENSIEKANLGVNIANDTATSLEEIVSGINESSQIVGEIARSSEEQLSGIEQINSGIDQVASVVQHNSATAQQSAAASEEMSSQSAMLRDLIAQFKLKNSDASRLRLPPPAIETGRSRMAPPRVGEAAPAFDGGVYGKY